MGDLGPIGSRSLRFVSLKKSKKNLLTAYERTILYTHRARVVLGPPRRVSSQMKDRTMSYELNYCEDSHDTTEFHSGDWNRENWSDLCELQHVENEFETIEDAAEYADTYGVGIYLVSRNERVSHVIRVIHGSKAEVRSV